MILITFWFLFNLTLKAVLDSSNDKHSRFPYDDENVYLQISVFVNMNGGHDDEASVIVQVWWK